MTSHAGHDHPPTREARAACRRGLPSPVSRIRQPEFEWSEEPAICANVGCGKEITCRNNLSAWRHVDGTTCPTTYIKMGTTKPYTYDREIKPMRRCPECGGQSWKITPMIETTISECLRCGRYEED